MRLFRIAAFAGLLLALAGCHHHSKSVDPAPAPPPPFDGAIAVVRESGGPLAGATVTVDGVAYTAGADGRVALPGLLGPVLAVVGAPGFLDEPVVLAREDAGADFVVRLLANRGPGGARRIVMHFGGDTMLGRRFETPTRPATVQMIPGDGGASARSIVASIAPLFAAAHVRSVNLETVVGNLPQSGAYPQKKFVILSPPETIFGLEALSVNVAMRGNNHGRDWLDGGVLATADSLDSSGIAHAGAGLDSVSAAAPVTLTAGGLTVGFVSYCTITGDLDNDVMPLDEDPAPPGLPPGCCDWQFQKRVFGFQGTTVTITQTAHRIGDAWQNEVKPVELSSTVSDPEKAALWAAASTVYPELLDLIARRGHGGPSGPPPSDGPVIAAARAAGADIVVVEIHGGTQYVPFKTRGADKRAHAAIDAGADIVVCHHPHVLQGFEWYKGKLIAYSIGNFVFDQDILPTYQSVVLRVVFEEKKLLEARVLPIVLDNYRTSAVGGVRAKRIVRTLAARSLFDAETAVISKVDRTVLTPIGPNVERAGFLFERNGARVVTAGALARTTIAIAATADRATDLPPLGLTRSRGPAGVTVTGLLLGEDLFGYGDFEDDAADGQAAGGQQWLQTAPFKRVEAVGGAPSGVYALRLRRSAADSQPVFSRPVSRAPIAAHLLFVDQGGGFVAPADGLTSHSMRFKVRFGGDHDAPTGVRFEVFHFDDSSPIDPTVNLLLRNVEIPYVIPMDGAWHEVLIDLPPDVLAPGPLGEIANELFFELTLDAPQEGITELFADDVQFLEWREAEFLPDGLYPVDAVRARDAGATVNATLERVGD